MNPSATQSRQRATVVRQLICGVEPWCCASAVAWSAGGRSPSLHPHHPLVPVPVHRLAAACPACTAGEIPDDLAWGVVLRLTVLVGVNLQRDG